MGVGILCGIDGAGAKQPLHWFLGGKRFRHPPRNKCMGWFAQIVILKPFYPLEYCIRQYPIEGIALRYSRENKFFWAWASYVI